MRTLRGAAAAVGERAFVEAVDRCIGNVLASDPGCPLGRLAAARAQAPGSERAMGATPAPAGKLLPRPPAGRLATVLDLLHMVAKRSAAEGDDVEFLAALAECDDHRARRPACPMNAVLERASPPETSRRCVELYGVVRRVLDSEPSEQVLPRALEALCVSLNYDLGELWRPPPDGVTGPLRLTSYWCESLDDGLLHFVTASYCTELGPGIGLPGRAWSERRTIEIEDIAAEDQAFHGLHLALRAGLRSALVVPLRGWRKFVGVMLLLGRHPQRLDPELVETISELGRHLGEFVEWAERAPDSPGPAE
jgi:hypothetical protein